MCVCESRYDIDRNDRCQNSDAPTKTKVVPGILPSRLDPYKLNSPTNRCVEAHRSGRSPYI